MDEVLSSRGRDGPSSAAPFVNSSSWFTASSPFRSACLFSRAALPGARGAIFGKTGAVHCLPFGFGYVRPASVGVTRRRWRRGGPCEASSSGGEQPDELLSRQADEVVRPVGADLGDRVEGDAPDLRAGVRENRGEVRNPALAGVPPAPEPAQAQEEQRLLLETEDGQDLVPSPSTPPPAPSVRTSGGPSPAPRSSLTINQDVSNLVLASVSPSITLSTILSLATGVPFVVASPRPWALQGTLSALGKEPADAAAKDKCIKVCTERTGRCRKPRSNARVRLLLEWPALIR